MWHSAIESQESWKEALESARESGRQWAREEEAQKEQETAQVVSITSTKWSEGSAGTA